MIGAATRRPEETVKCGICLCGTEREHRMIENDPLHGVCAELPQRDPLTGG